MSFSSLAVSITPTLPPPQAVNIISAPLFFICFAITLAFALSVNEFVNCIKVLEFGFISFIAFSNPTEKLEHEGISIPPINPTTLLFVIWEATNPTTYPACSSLNVIALKFSGITSNVLSIVANFCSGYICDASIIESPTWNPTPTIKSLSWSIAVSIFDVKSDSDLLSKYETSTPYSSLAFKAPSHALWLKLWSFTPPWLNTKATLNLSSFTSFVLQPTTPKAIIPVNNKTLTFLNIKLSPFYIKYFINY